MNVNMNFMISLEIVVVLSSSTIGITAMKEFYDLKVIYYTCLIYLILSKFKKNLDICLIYLLLLDPFNTVL